MQRKAKGTTEKGEKAQRVSMFLIVYERPVAPGSVRNFKTFLATSSSVGNGVVSCTSRNGGARLYRAYTDFVFIVDQG